MICCCVVLYSFPHLYSFFFFFNDTATTEIYTLSLHDALPISRPSPSPRVRPSAWASPSPQAASGRSEEHTSELQSPCNLVCRLLLEKKKKTKNTNILLKQIFESRRQKLSIIYVYVCYACNDLD